MLVEEYIQEFSRSSLQTTIESHLQSRPPPKKEKKIFKAYDKPSSKHIKSK